MVELDNGLVITFVIGGVTSLMIVRVLSFLIKSRCTSIKCCGSECQREVITEANLSKNIIREIEIPKELVNIKKSLK